MDIDRAIGLLRKRLLELQTLPPDRESQEFDDWRERTARTLDRTVGRATSHSFLNITWRSKTLGTEAAFQAGRRKAESLLRGVIFELDELWEPEELASSAWFDPKLWQHVRYLLQDEKWDQVASQTAIFVESKIRRWTALPASTFGKDLMAAALRRGAGAFPLGRTAGEQEGWLALGIGFTAALGNADRHRIQQRDDARRHAVGVLGVGSLLLTQLRYEHGNRFMDEPEPAAGGDEQPGLLDHLIPRGGPGHVGLRTKAMKGIVLLKRRRAASRSAVGVQDAGESEAADRLWIASGGAH